MRKGYLQVIVSGGLVFFSAAPTQAASTTQQINDYLNTLPDVKTLPASRQIINKGTPQVNGLATYVQVTLD
jgi:hypothetical protein